MCYGYEMYTDWFIVCTMYGIDLDQILQCMYVYCSVSLWYVEIKDVLNS